MSFQEGPHQKLFFHLQESEDERRARLDEKIKGMTSLAFKWELFSSSNLQFFSLGSDECPWCSINKRIQYFLDQMLPSNTRLLRIVASRSTKFNLLNVAL